MSPARRIMRTGSATVRFHPAGGTVTVKLDCGHVVVRKASAKSAGRKWRCHACERLAACGTSRQKMDGWDFWVEESWDHARNWPRRTLIPYSPKHDD